MWLELNILKVSRAKSNVESVGLNQIFKVLWAKSNDKCSGGKSIVDWRWLRYVKSWRSKGEKSNIKCGWD